jgi:hypothetical protein
MPDTETVTEQQLRKALDEHGSVLQVSKAWECTRQAVYYHMAKHGVPNPRTGDVPTMGRDT